MPSYYLRIYHFLGYGAEKGKDVASATIFFTKENYPLLEERRAGGNNRLVIVYEDTMRRI